MKEYIKLFNGINSADGYNINDIPFTSTIKATSGDTDFNLRCNNPNSNIIVENGEIRLLKEVTISGVWNPLLSNKDTKIIISGNVDLFGMTDCYSIEFANGGHLTINPDARLRIWQGGILNSDAENVSYFTFESRLSSTYEGLSDFGELLLHPALRVNNHPKAAIKMLTNIGYDESQNYYWHVFSLLVNPIESIQRDPQASLGIYKWDYTNHNWTAVSGLSELVYNEGFNMTANMLKQSMTVIFESNIKGNDNFLLTFHAQGYNMLGNAFTAKLKVENIISIFPSSVKEIYIKTVDGSEQVTTGFINPGYPIIIRTLDASVQLVSTYENLIWNPSFEEESVPTRSLSKGGSSIKSEAPDLPIFNDPVIKDEQELQPNTK